jgi:PAS domain S-box-containing protein
VLFADPRGVNIQANEEAARMTGYSVEELLAGVWMVHPEDTKARDLFEQAIRKGIAGTDYETRFVRKDGSIWWASVSWKPVRDEHGGIAGVCTVFVDISDRKTAEDELRRVDERYRELSEKASDMFWEMGLDGRFTYISGSARHLGYEPEECIGHSLLEFLPPDEQAVFMERLSNDTRNPGPARYEVRALKKDGSDVWMEVIVDVITENGKALGLHGVARDISQRRQAEEALRENEQKYRSIVENSSDLIMLCRPDGVWTYASPACRDIIGYEPEEVVGTMHRLSLPEDAEWLVPIYLRALKGESRSRLEYRIVTKNGEIRWVSHSWSPIFVGERLQAVLSVIRDVTKAKKSEEVLRAAHAELEQSYRLQREFLNNVTHEVRTPLTAVKGYAEMLMEGVAGPISQEQAALLGKVLTSSQHLLDVVNGVLEMARLKSGKIALNPRVCNPRLIVDKSASTIVPQAEQKGLAINIQSDPTPCPGMYDEGKLVIILTNLLTNAVKFTKTGSIDVLIHCRASGAEIVVADSGMGISSADLPTIFDEFSQLEDPRKHKPSGFGIGLAIVATMVETIGAGLTVSSREGVGTAFTLRVPVLEEQPLGSSDSSPI